MKLADLIESCVDYNDVQIEKYNIGQKAFKENKIHIKGKSNYENYALVENLPKGTKFVVLIDEYNSNESGDFSWYFCIMIKYHELYITLHDRG